MLAESLVARREIGEQLADRGAADLHGLFLVGERAKRRRNVELCSAYVRRSGSKAERSSRNRQDVIASGLPARTDTMMYEKNGHA